MDQVGCRSGAMVTMPRNPESPEGDVVSARIGPEIALERHQRVHVQCLEPPPETTHHEHPTIRVTPTAKDFELVGVAVGAIIGTPQSEASASTVHGPARTVCGAPVGKSEGAATKRPVTESAEAAGAGRGPAYRQSRRSHGSTERTGRQTVQHAAANVEDTMNMNDHRRLEAIGHVTVLSTEYEPRGGSGRRCCATVPPVPATLVGWAATMAVLDERGATRGEEATPHLPIAHDTMGAR